MARTETKRQILDLAEGLLQDRGYNSFSYNSISEQLGIKNAAVHYHFPSKADLGKALIHRYRARFHRYTQTLEKGGADPMLKLEAYFTIPWGYLRNGGKVCPLGMLESEFNSIPESMRKEVLQLDREIREWLAKSLEEGRKQGIFRFNGAAAEKALLMVAALQGALQLSRAVGQDGFSCCVQQLKRDLGLLTA
ncbi:MAG: TetR/AcrR family transcriptional regulator [Acidiferrobacterales bacterium]